MTYRKVSAPKLVPAATLQAVDVALASIIKWADGELNSIENQLRIPEVRGLQFETLRALPDRYKGGDLYYGAAGVFGAQEGLYIYDNQPPSGWRRL